MKPGQGFNPICYRSGTDQHDGVAIGYEKMYIPPRMEPRGKNLVRTEPAYNRYFVVRACRHCDAVWWDEDEPYIRTQVAS